MYEAAFSWPGFEATVNADIFFDFVRSTLIPNMHHFNGTNPRSIVDMNNYLSVHHTDDVLGLLIKLVFLCFFCPPTVWT